LLQERVMEQRDKFGIRAELKKADDPRPVPSRVATVSELIAALSRYGPEEDIWIPGSLSRSASQLVGSAGRLEIPQILDEYEKRKPFVDPHGRRERKAGSSGDDQAKLRMILIREAENVFGSKNEAHAWFNRPNPRLNDQTLADMLATSDGRNRVHEMLVQIDKASKM